MNSNKSISMSAALLAVVLAATMFSVPAAADDFGAANRIKPYSDSIGPYDPVVTVGPYDPADTVGPYDPAETVGPCRRRVSASGPGFRADNGQPGSKKPGAYSGSGKALATLNFKFGAMHWRIKLVHPVWIPVLSIFSRAGVSQ